MRAALVLMVVAACGDNLEGIAIDDYLDAARAADCRYYVQCGFLRDLESCERANLGRHQISPRFAEAVHAGSILWYPRAAAECLAKRATASCDRGDPARRYTCERLWEPTLHDGEACTLNGECISGECWSEDEQVYCTTGTCVGNVAPVPAPLGDSCRIASCAEGFCDRTQTCAPLRQDGDSCSADYECEAGLACGWFQCARLPDRGEPCVQNCRLAGDVCNSATYRCTAAGTLGVSCISDDDCSSFYTCGPNKECAEPQLHAGDHCDRDAQCRDPESFCDVETDTCMTPKPEGAACLAPYECESWVCDAFTRVCSHCD